MEAHSYHFTPLNSLNDISTDTDDDNELVADVVPETLIPIAQSELKIGKASGLDKGYNEILKKAIGIGFYTYSSGTSSLKLGYILYIWKIAVLCLPRVDRCVHFSGPIFVYEIH